MKIEPATLPSDINSLKAVAASAFAEGNDSNIEDWFSFEEMQAQIQAKQGYALKATKEDKIVGFIYSQQENPINGPEGIEKWMIVIIAVEPSESGNSIGSQLISATEEICKTKGAAKLFVYTNKGDKDVVGFYKKNGYEDAGWVKDYQHGSNNSAVFLLKHLNEQSV